MRIFSVPPLTKRRVSDSNGKDGGANGKDGGADGKDGGASGKDGGAKGQGWRRKTAGVAAQNG